MFDSIANILITGGVALIGIISAFFVIKQSGKKEAEQEQLTKSFQQAKEANEIRQNVRILPDKQLDDELHKHQRD